MKKKKGNSRKLPSKSFSKTPSKANLGDISLESKGKVFSLMGIVDRIVQTGGPTIFFISDGTGTLALKGFEGAGMRAFSFINEGDALSANVKIEEFKGEIEGEILKVDKLKGDDYEKFLKHLSDIERKRAQVKEIPFLVPNVILEKLKDRIIEAATEIRRAIIQNRPIIVRHHNDTDGYSAGFALEKAIVPLIQKQHGAGKAPWELYTRAPCAAPYYEIDDSIRDTSHSLSDVAKFSNKLPLVIIADNGSSPEDLLGIKQGKVHGIDFIVIDHHYFDEDVISPEVLVHINPFLVGEDGSKFSAGMLCTEIARFVNPEITNVEFIAALAGLADRVDNPHVMDEYLKLADSKGYPKSLLSDISTVMDFVSSKVRFMEAREYIEVIFGEPHDKQKSLVELMAPYIRGLESKGLEIAKSSVSKKKIGDTTLQFLDIDETFPGFGFYPKPGKTIGLVHDYAKENGDEKLVSIGVMRSALTIRATDGANFSVHELINFLNEKLPDAFAEGGGHKNAGAITFTPKKKEDILKLVSEFIKKRD